MRLVILYLYKFNNFLTKIFSRKYFINWKQCYLERNRLKTEKRQLLIKYYLLWKTRARNQIIAKKVVSVEMLYQYNLPISSRQSLIYLYSMSKFKNLY